MPAPQKEILANVFETNHPGVSDKELDRKLSVLRTVFKHGNFKGRQEEVINAILQGRNCLIVLPTGAGKTICYTVPAIVNGGVTVVISPLLSLMLEQVEYLRSKGLNVCYMNSAVSQVQREIIIHNMLSDIPPYNFLFVTPESATSSVIMDVFKKMKAKGTLSYIALDECHCIDLWGFDFRPAYANLGILSELNCQIVALTATCTSRTEAVILSSLKLTDAIVIRETCNRPNISLLVKSKKGDGKEQVSDEITAQHKSQCGIVYCLQRADTTDMAYILQSKGISATYYHGALDAYKKKENTQAWQNGKALVMCATVAFGMGINKQDVRFIIHLSIPQSLECYAQEFGRAGRDGEQATSCILFRFEDRTRHLQIISSIPEGDHRTLKLNSLNEMAKFCIKPECRKNQLVQYFGECLEVQCDQMCDFCRATTIVEKTDASVEALEILSCLNNMKRLCNKVTLNLLMLVYRGSKRKEILAKSFNTIPEFGKGKNVFNELSLKRFLHMLISENVLIEQLRGQNETGSIPYLVSGNKEELIKQGDLIFYKYKI